MDVQTMEARIERLEDTVDKLSCALRELLGAFSARLAGRREERASLAADGLTDEDVDAAEGPGEADEGKVIGDAVVRAVRAGAWHVRIFASVPGLMSEDHHVSLLADRPVHNRHCAQCRDLKNFEPVCEACQKRWGEAWELAHAAADANAAHMAKAKENGMATEHFDVASGQWVASDGARPLMLTIRHAPGEAAINASDPSGLRVTA